jgi:tetratricopeptide (TPR) repeat protein
VAGKAETVRDRQEAEPVDLAKMANRATPVASARAPSPAETPYALREVDDSSFIVTGSRRSRVRRVERGDWNACTVNDPRQRLTACKWIVDPAAKGVAGVAAARIADGLIQAWQGNNSEAIDKFDQAIATDPRSAFAHLNRGLAYANSGDLDRAIADLDQAVRYEPRDARGYYNRSVLLRQRGDIRRARIDEGRAVDLDPSYSDVVR